MKSTHSHNKADYVGILGSVLCIVHCLIMPVLAFGSTMASNHVHTGLRSLDFLFIVINGAAVYFATRQHKSLPLKVLLWGALLLFAVSLTFEGKHPAFVWLSYVGSALLIAGHFINLYICQIAPRFKMRIS